MASPTATSQTSGPVDFETVREDERQWLVERRRILELEGDPSAANLFGLALSGGGIRSATFGLGVLQALAHLNLLRSVDYLSTVSGGGFIGSWLTAWSKRGIDPERADCSQKRFKDVVEALNETPEPDAIRFVRDHNNYLTPRRGLLGIDSLTFALVYLRNLLLNLSIVIPASIALLLLPRTVVLTWDWLARTYPTGWIVPLALWFVFLVLARACAEAVRSGTTTRTCKGKTKRALLFQSIRLVVVRKADFISAVFVILSAWSLSFLFFIKPAFVASLPWRLPVVIVAGVGAYAVLWLLGVQLAQWFLVDAKRPPITFWHSVAGLFAGVFGVGSLYGVYVAAELWSSPYPTVTWGPTLIVLSYILTSVMHFAFARTQLDEEARERWSRLVARQLRVLGGLLALFLLSLYVPLVVEWLWKSLSNGTPDYKSLAPLAGAVVSALGLAVRWFFGASEKLGRRALFAAKGASYLFACGLVTSLSELTHLLIPSSPGWALPAALAGAAAVSGSFSWLISINDYSMHAFYHNRLVRCFLGASRPPQPEGTRFDPEDDLALTAMSKAAGYAGPYPLINTAVNLVSGKQLAWQHRKAASFVFSPLYCGYRLPRPAQAGGNETKHATFGRESLDFFVDRNLETNAYRPTESYAEKVSLGRAMAISGAAVSPNMGFYSSPALSLVLTLLNVRLGQWIGNPRHRYAWKRRAPRFGLLYLFRELLGVTHEDGGYVYVSDGGHFDNLGVYELVRRRCRFILAVDAGEDRDKTFEAVGQVVQKCRVDLNAEIELDLEPLRSGERHGVVGKVTYQDKSEPGVLVYVRPSLSGPSGDEPPDVKAYAAQNPDFPHEATSNQWFSEWQFESYRKLGLHVAESILEPASELLTRAHPVDLEKVFERLQKHWYASAPRSRESFTRHGTALIEIWERIRNDPNLEFLDLQVYEGLRGSPGLPAPDRSTTPWHYGQWRAGFYVSNQIIQLMENVFLDLELDRKEARENPDNQGWIAFFQRWAGSSVFKSTWEVVGTTYGSRFQLFCQRSLDLPEIPTKPEDSPV